MIFDSLKLHNYGLYKGEHHLWFSKGDERKNVTLIGGLNGAGKTTILEALQIALYGRQAPVAQGTVYEQLLQDRINRRVSQKDGAAVQLQFRVQEDGAQKSYSVTRSWSARGNRVREDLAVAVDGRYDEVLTSTWTEHAERFIPARLAPLFFFDGEKIEALADPERSTEAIRTAMEALLGLDIISQLMTDLNTLERRKLKEISGDSAKSDVSSKVAELEKLYLKQRESLSALRQKEAGLKNDHDVLAKRLQSVQRELSAQGGDAYEARKEIEARHADAVRELAAADDRLREVASGDLPLFLLFPKLKSLGEQARRAAEEQKRKGLRDFVKRHDETLLDFVENQPAAVSELKVAIAAFLQEQFRTNFGNANGITTFNLMDEKTKDSVIFLCQNLPKDERDARRLLAEHDKLTLKVQTLERSLSTIPEEDAIATVLALREQLKSETAEMGVRLKIVSEEIDQATRQFEATKANLERELQKEAVAIRTESEEARLIEHSRKAINTLATFKRRLLEKHAGRLGTLVQESFSHLTRKDALTSRVQINPEDCTLSLFDGQGDKIAPDRLSAGERQLLAVSLLWGLARAAGRPLPVVVDTPLGRLDSIHRLNLVTKYFPFASHQVIVLSTDEEIDGKLLQHIRPYVGNSYLLEFDNELGHSVVRPGYFAEAEAIA